YQSRPKGRAITLTLRDALPILAALERGDLDVNTEIWLNSVGEPWAKAEKTGKVKRVADLYTGGEAWFIPKYVAEKFPDLKSAARSEEHTSELQSREKLVCRPLL